MASEKQIAANRRNATKSTGPRSRAGRQRSSRNAYRYGLSLNVFSSPEVHSHLEECARKIAGDDADPFTLERARAIAEAELDIARVRHTRAGLIQRAYAFGALDPPHYTTRGILHWIREFEGGIELPLQAAMKGVPDAMPSEEQERSVEAIRRCIPELRKIDRYERRAAARRDRAVLALLQEEQRRGKR
jgi:hypothetical protein